jgi:transposase
MISPGANFRIYVANAPVDFRKGMDGLAAIVQSEFELDPFSGAIFVFRAKRADRLKIIVWDGTGLILIHKRIEGAGFVWPRKNDGVVSLTHSQFGALFDGLDWTQVRGRVQRRPVAT